MAAPPERRQKSQRVADDRSQDDAEHPEATRQQHREQDVPSDLASVTDIVAGLISVGIDHLAQIRDHDVEHGVERRPAVIDGRKRVDFAVDPVGFEIDIPKKDQQQCADRRDGNTQDQPLPVDLIGAAFVHGTDLPAVEDAGANGNDCGEKGHKAGYRRDCIDRRHTGFAYKITCDDVVAKEHDIDDRHRKGAGQQHRLKFAFAEALFPHRRDPISKACCTTAARTIHIPGLVTRR